jgi:hypothetical protein
VPKIGTEGGSQSSEGIRDHALGVTTLSTILDGEAGGQRSEIRSRRSECAADPLDGLRAGSAAADTKPLAGMLGKH